MAELVVRRLRDQLVTVAESVAAGVRVSTETGLGQDGGPPSLPWLLVAEDGHGWDWPAVQRAVIRLTGWHRDTYTAKRLAGLALGLLCAPHSRPERCSAVNPSPHPSRVSTRTRLRRWRRPA
ncbi:hypothetical protein ILP97_00050 [Amycolatopsis sp. H6(2020)]|nr:hypothetical protein [Amycolatopsis sp. H6(2020)]